MLITDYDFGAFVRDGKERYFWMTSSAGDKSFGTDTLRFPDSLLSFLYLDVSEVEPAFRKLREDLWQLTLTHEQQYVDSIFAELELLAARHVYFREFSLAYQYRVSQSVLLGDYTENVLQLRQVDTLLGDTQGIQKQVLDLIEHVLDIDGAQKPVRKKLAEFYHARGTEAFQFRPQPMRFELIDAETFVEVLHPESVYDLTDYHVRECIRQETRMRRCKYCGRYFAIQRRSTAEYCDRVIDGRGHTCKDIGARVQWTQSKKDDTLFNDYRREYKTRFARTKVGKYTTDELYAWGALAREKVEACRAGKITEAEFHAWLKKS